MASGIGVRSRRAAGTAATTAGIGAGGVPGISGSLIVERLDTDCGSSSSALPALREAMAARRSLARGGSISPCSGNAAATAASGRGWVESKIDSTRRSVVPALTTVPGCRRWLPETRWPSMVQPLVLARSIRFQFSPWCSKAQCWRESLRSRMRTWHWEPRPKW
jgi:hypothetical protein